MGKLSNLYKANGPEWMSRYLLYRAASRANVLSGRIVGALEHRMKRFEVARAIPGENTKEINRETWSRWDWSRGGEEWSPSPQWKRAFAEDVIERYLGNRSTIVEIGPGAGRWTEFLQRTAERLILVDLTQRCIDLCRARFADANNIEYHVNDGATLPFLPDDSVDGVFSYDVFVHIAPQETRTYLSEFARVLKPGGIGVIHHPNERVEGGGFRSSVTAALFAEAATDAGMVVERQFESWADGAYDVGAYGDVISVFRK